VCVCGIQRDQQNPKCQGARLCLATHPHLCTRTPTLKTLFIFIPTHYVHDCFPKNGETPLHWAAGEGWANIVDLLITRKAKGACVFAFWIAFAVALRGWFVVVVVIVVAASAAAACLIVRLLFFSFFS
jgi:hypothetical protein